MSQVKFFSNSLIVLGGECETTFSLKDTRINPQQIFQVPEHIVNTNNLLVFIDGKITIRGRDYIDRNSYEVEFTSPIPTDVDFFAIHLRMVDDGSGDNLDGLGIITNVITETIEVEMPSYVFSIPSNIDPLHFVILNGQHLIEGVDYEVSEQVIVIERVLNAGEHLSFISLGSDEEILSTIKDTLLDLQERIVELENKAVEWIDF